MKSLVPNFQGEMVFRTILEIMKDGRFRAARGAPDTPPLNQYVRVSPDELKKFVKKDGTPDTKMQDRYIKKKRRLILDVFNALHLVDITRLMNRTRASTYALTPFGQKLQQGLIIMDKAEAAGLSYQDVHKKLFGIPDASHDTKIGKLSKTLNPNSDTISVPVSSSDSISTIPLIVDDIHDGKPIKTVKSNKPKPVALTSLSSPSKPLIPPKKNDEHERKVDDPEKQNEPETDEPETEITP